MEDLNQAYGYILYRTTIQGPVAGDLVLDELTTTRRSTQTASCWERSTGGWNKNHCTLI